MKKIIATAALALLAAGAQAQTAGAYVGTDVFSNRISGVGSTTGLGVFGGYRFGNGLAVEASANRIGRYDFGFATLSINDFNVSALYSLPVTGDLSVFGRLGYGSLRVSDRNRLDDSGFKLDNGLIYGVGVNYQVTKNIGIRGEFRKPASDVDSIGVGVSFGF
jgi:hypothetical protein